MFESAAPSMPHSLSGLPGFWFSRTTGFVDVAFALALCVIALVTEPDSELPLPVGVEPAEPPPGRTPEMAVPPGAVAIAPPGKTGAKLRYWLDGIVTLTEAPILPIGVVAK